MVKKKASLEEQVAEEYVAPTILKLLKPYSATEMARAITENINLAKGLREEAKVLNELKLYLNVAVPFSEKLAKKLKQKKWIDWFIENAMKHKRPDLYNQIIYTPKGARYIRKEVRKIVKLLFG
jgi:hypothetical protein